MSVGHGQKTVNERGVIFLWVETVRDTPDDMTATLVCPACESERVETLPGEGVAEEPEYRCLDCGTFFDAGGGEPPLADSDDPDTP